MNEKIEITPNQSSSVPNPTPAPGITPQKISKPLVIAAAVFSMIITLALVLLFAWLDHESEPEHYVAPTVSSQPDAVVGLLAIAIVLAFILLPGVIVALIVLPKLLKNRKK